jgi:release factor glutamine methyltransferase
MSLVVSTALQDGRRRMAASETAALDAQVWLAHVLGRPRAWLLAHGEQPLTAEQEQAWQAGLARLERGEPLPYLLGEWEFYGLTFQVSPAVLIPRPETELLIEEAIAWLRAHPGRRAAADVGTGSGAIPVAIAANVADVDFTAVDISPEALAVAQANVKRHGLAKRIALRQNDLLDGLSAPLDLITANLPYIPSQRLPGLAVTKWEPHIALDGGADGLDLIRRLFEQASWLLRPGGLLLEEIDPGLEESSSALARHWWPAAEIRVLADLTGQPRLLRVQTAA